MVGSGFAFPPPFIKYNGDTFFMLGSVGFF